VKTRTLALALMVAGALQLASPPRAVARSFTTRTSTLATARATTPIGRVWQRLFAPRRQEPARVIPLRPAPTKRDPAPLFAILPDGRQVPPSSFAGGYHGNGDVSPEVALREGLAGRGDDWRLREHSEQRGGSAFRGATGVVSEPLSGNGAAYWAGEGGWVYEIRGVPSWDVNVLLEGRVNVVGTWRGNLMHGEQEIAIPARVSPERIRAYGRVEADAAGRLFVRQWILNPGYRPPAASAPQARLTPRAARQLALAA
jgi:hypothetical protein